MSETALSLCMIVKNEVPNLPRALGSLRGVADELLVVDTGSTDGTPELARELGARVLSFEWNDSFASARNFALDQAGGDWALIMDADEELHPEDAHLVRPLLQNAEVEAYIFTAISYVGSEPGRDALADHRVYLVRRRPEYRYTGALHENIEDRILAARPGGRLAVAQVRVLHYGYLDGELARKGKRERNREILERQLEAQPENRFLRYALATEHLALGELDQARRLLLSALEAGPDAHFRSDVLVKLAFCARQSGHGEEEVGWLQQAAEEYPDYTDVWFQLGVCHAEAADWPQAEACLRLCLALGESPPQYQSLQGCGSDRAWLALGEVYERKGRPLAARTAYMGCLHARPLNREALSRLVRLLAAEPAGSAVGQVARDFDLAAPETALALAVAFRRAGAPLHAHMLLRAGGGEPGPAIYLERARACLSAAAGWVSEAGPRCRAAAAALARLGDDPPG